MKKRALSLALLFVAVMLFSFVTPNITPAVSADEEVTLPPNGVMTVAVSSVNAKSDKVLEARFLNMLNHNFVYGEAFDNVEDIVNNSVIALLDMRDSEEDSYIREGIVSDYIFNMYGIEIDDYSGINPDFPEKEGYVFILPRGFSVYEHEIIAVSVNEDGSYTVKTKVSVNSHDSEGITEVCTTLFVENPESQFGFSIISSEIGVEAVAL